MRTGQNPLLEGPTETCQGSPAFIRRRSAPAAAPSALSLVSLSVHNEGLGGHNPTDPDCVRAELAKPLFGIFMKASDAWTGPNLCPRALAQMLLSVEQLVGVAR